MMLKRWVVLTTEYRHICTFAGTCVKKHLESVSVSVSVSDI